MWCFTWFGYQLQDLKNVKYPWRSAPFSKVASFILQFIKSDTGASMSVFPRFLNNVNGTKLRKKTQMVNEYKQLTGNHEQMSVNKKADFYVKNFTASVS